MWGLMTQRCTPTKPDPSLLKEFHERFSNADQIQCMLSNSNAARLIAKANIKTLRDAKQGRVKIGKGMIHISQFFLEYMWSTLAKIGFRFWAPNLDAQPDSLYNEACRMSAIFTFRQAIVNKVYAYMNINQTYVKEIGLLESAYNHYVHYYMTQIHAKEKKEEGKHIRDEEKKVIQRSRQRVSFHWIIKDLYHTIKSISILVERCALQVCHQEQFYPTLPRYPSINSSPQQR